MAEHERMRHEQEMFMQRQRVEAYRRNPEEFMAFAKLHHEEQLRAIATRHAAAQEQTAVATDNVARAILMAGMAGGSDA